MGVITKFCFMVIALLLVVVDFSEESSINPRPAANIENILAKAEGTDQDRIEFLKYHFNRGYELTQKALNKSVPQSRTQLTDQESVLLYHYLSNNIQVTDPEKVREYISKECVPILGTCIDFDDPGIHPM